MVIATAGPALAQPPVPVRYSTRTLAMGNATLLSSNPIEVGYYNPGALSLTGGFHIYVPMVQVNLNYDVIDFIDYIDKNEATFQNFNSMDPISQLNFINDMNEEIGGHWVGLDMDPMIGIQMGKLSLSAYSVSRAQIRLDASAVPPYAAPLVQLRQDNDVVINAALGIQAGPLLHGGVGVRFLNRTRKFETFEPLDLNLGIGLGLDMTEENTQTTGVTEETLTGFAVDVGGTFTLTKALAVGGLVRGLVSGMEDAEWEPEISAGIRVKPLELLLGIPKILIRDLTLEADIQDITNVRGEKFDEKLQLGAELKIPFFALRAGMNRGKFTYGAGFHFLIADLAFAKTSLPVFTPSGVEDQDLYSFSVGLGF